MGRPDERQTRLLDSLRAARGAAVSFDELRSTGIENPATLCYELEATGTPIARVRKLGAGRQCHQADLRSVGVRLEEPDGRRPGNRPRLPPSPPAWRRWHTPGGMTLPRLRSRMISSAYSVWPITLAATLMLTAAAATLTTLALTNRQAARSTDRTRVFAGISSGSRHQSHPVTHRPRASAPAALVGAKVASATPPPANAGGEDSAVHAPAPAGGASSPHSQSGASTGPQGSPAAQDPSAASSPVQLQDEGHQLLGEGRYQAAISDLHAALLATGQSAIGCAHPTTETCLTYAYALYDLGRALRLDGDTAAAVPILTQRLRIDNQRPTVQNQLDLALAQLNNPPGRQASGSHGI